MIGRSLKYLRNLLPAGVLSLALFASPACAATFGLVVGINKYPHFQDLQGAVDDARDIKDGLEALGAAEIVMLLDEQATREAIIAAWRRIMDRSAPGDVVVFSYAGHGGQEKEKVAGSEPDGKDETLLLHGFDPTSEKGRRQRILDNEINAWFQEARDRGVQVIFVADACHAGGATRSLDRRVVPGFRAGPPYDVDDDPPLSPEVLAGARLTGQQLPNVLFLAATHERLRTPEVLINGRWRGALSRAFAEALRGQADSNGDGATTRTELKKHIDVNVRLWSDARQYPEFSPLSQMDEKLFRHRRPVSPAPPRAAMPGLPRLRMAVINLPESEAVEVVRAIAGVDYAGPGMGADLTWDAAERSVISASSDEVATDIDRAQLGAVAWKWRTLLYLKMLAGRHGLAMTMRPDDSRHERGTRVEFGSEPLQYPYMTVFNLAGNGAVQFLYPRPGETVASEKGRPFRLPLRVLPPFGADHLVLIASDRPLRRLHRRLATARIDEVASMVDEALKNTAFQIGIQPLFTVAKKEEW